MSKSGNVGSLCAADGAGGASALAKAVQLATFPLRRPAGRAITSEHRPGVLERSRGRGVIDDAVSGDRCAHAFVDDPNDLEDPLSPREPNHDAIADRDARGGLGRLAVDLHVSAVARIGGSRPSRVLPHRPQPFVDPRRLHGPMLAALSGRGGGVRVAHRRSIADAADPTSEGETMRGGRGQRVGRYQLRTPGANGPRSSTRSRPRR